MDLRKASFHQKFQFEFSEISSRQWNSGRVPFDQNFREFRFKIEWNKKFPETHFENFDQSLEVVLFFENLEIPEFAVPFGISTRHESALVPLTMLCLDQGDKMAACQHCTECKTICHNPRRFLIAYTPQKRYDLLFWKKGLVAWFA